MAYTLQAMIREQRILGSRAHEHSLEFDPPIGEQRTFDSRALMKYYLGRRLTSENEFSSIKISIWNQGHVTPSLTTSLIIDPNLQAMIP